MAMTTRNAERLAQAIERAINSRVQLAIDQHIAAARGGGGHGHPLSLFHKINASEEDVTKSERHLREILLDIAQS